MNITELPPFNPRLDDYKAEEFVRHTLLLLEYPIEIDQDRLDRIPFQVKPPPLPPEPVIPMLQPIWYPKPLQSVSQLATRVVQAPRPPLFLGEAAQGAFERILRPLLAGHGGVQVHGESGIGKSTLLHHIAHHERTRQRFRRIWYFDDPYRVGQLCAILLNDSKILAQADWQLQYQQLASVLDDDTLLIVDNLSPQHPMLNACWQLSPFVLLGVETPPVIPEVDEHGDEHLPPDPDGVVTLHRWDTEDSVSLLAQVGKQIGRKGIARETRPILEEITILSAGHPLGLAVLGAMMSEDDIPPQMLLSHLQSLMRMHPLHPGVQLALFACTSAMPEVYQQLLDAFGAFSPLGISQAALQTVVNIRNDIQLQQGMTLLKRRHLIRQDHRLEDHFVPAGLVYAQATEKRPHDPGKNIGIRARAWMADTISQMAYEPANLFLLEHHLRYAYQIVSDHKLHDFAGRFSSAVSDYLRTYLPALLPHDAPPPRLMGERAQAIQQARHGVELAESGDVEQGRESIQSALQTLKAYGSGHDTAQVLTMLAYVEDRARQPQAAVAALERAAKLVFDLDAFESVSVVRLGLAIAYRHMGRFRDALAVLDERPEAEAERARIYRAMGDMNGMLAALNKSGEMTPYERAESYLQAQRYADALEAISQDNTPQSLYLRALIYHLQGDYEHALRGYEQALKNYRADDPNRAILARSMAAIHALQGDYEQAESQLAGMLETLKDLDAPEQWGLTQALLAAVHLIQGNNRTATETATQALQKLTTSKRHMDVADCYRVLGRANWRLQRYDDAMTAFAKVTEHTQSEALRSETRIGMAFFHLGEACRKTEQLDRALPNLRRALTHTDPDDEPSIYLMIQSALYRVFREMDRLPDAIETNQAIIEHLDKHRPPDLQHLGFALMQNVRLWQQQGNHDRAYKSFLRWLNTLAGRADALTDEKRPALAVLALGLATRSLYAHNRSEEATPLAIEALRIADEQLTQKDQQTVVWAARRDYGEVLIAQEQWQPAYDILLPILRKEVAEDAHTYATINELAGTALHNLKDYRKALEYFWIALDAQVVPQKQGLIFEKAANTYLSNGETGKAVENFNEAIKLIDRKTAPGIAARILTSLAHTLAGVNRYADSIGVYEEALDMLRNVPDASPLFTARVYASLGRSNERQGQLYEASQAYRQALDIFEQRGVKAPEDYRGIMLRLARVLVVRGSYDTAIPYFETARDEAHNWGTRQEVGNITRELAEAQRDSEQLELALQSYADGLELLTIEYPKDRAAMLRSYGQALSIGEQFEEARRAWQEALELTADLSPLEIALTHHAIGQAFRAQKVYENAELAFREALNHHPKGSIEQAATYRELGETLLEAAKLDDALPALHVALDIEKGLPQQSNARLVKTLQLLGVTEERRGKRHPAMTHYHAALVYMDKAFQPQLYAYTLRKLGQLYADGEQWDECQKAYGESLDIEMHLPNRSEERIAANLRLIAEAYKAEGHLENTANAYKRLASYANLSKEDASTLRTALDDIERYKATLNAALDSLHVMEKSGGEGKDFAFVHALIVRMYYLLSDFEQSRIAMARLVKYLNDHESDFVIEDKRPDYRALGHLRLALTHEKQQQIEQAREHYQQALKDNTDSAMRWLIEQSMQAVMES